MSLNEKMWRIGVLVVIALFLNMPVVFSLEISNVRAEEITDRSAVVKWETDEAASTFVNYGVSEDNLATVGDAKLVTEHIFKLDNLLSSSKYYFGVRSGETELGGYDFETLEEDTEAPEIEMELPEMVPDDKIDVIGETEVGVDVSLEVNRKLAGREKAVDGQFSFADVSLKGNDWNDIALTAEDAAGNQKKVKFRVFSDNSPPVIELKDVPKLVMETRIKLEGTVSEVAKVEIMVNNKSVYSEETDKITADISLQEGENEILVVAEDQAGLKGEARLEVKLDSQAPRVQAKLAKGSAYYQGRAITDITGETKPGAKMYLYFFRRDSYERDINFKRAQMGVTADAEGKFKFSEVNFEIPSISEVLKDLGPKEIPAGLEDVVIPPLEFLREQQQWMYEVYILAEDDLGRVSVPPWKQVITIYSCYGGEMVFNVDPLVEFQMPYKLDPSMMDQGRQIVSSIVKLDYIGDGVEMEEELGFRITGTPRLEKACTPGMLENDDFKLSCKIFPRSLRLKPNAEKTAWYMQATLARTDELSERDDNYWNDFKDRQLTFPLKMTVSYQERGVDGQWGATKTQVSCFDLGYFVDIPIESDELIPDFLANEGVAALNWTIEQIELILPYLEKIMMVTGITCGISVVTKMAARYYRLFISRMEPVLDAASQKEEDERCPKEQKNLVLKSTAEGEGWPANRAPQEGEFLDDKCVKTAKAWKAEYYLNSALRWVCDRFFCHEAPAGWTADADESRVMNAKIKEQSCGTYAARGVPLRELENCKEHVEEKPREFSPNALKSKEFDWFLKEGNDVCYVDSSNGNVYIYYEDYQDAQLVEKGIYKLRQIGNRHGSRLGTMNKQLIAYKPDGSDTFTVGVNEKCKDLCRKKKGFSEWRCAPVDNKGEPEKLELGEQVADFTVDCFPQSGIYVSDTEKSKMPLAGGLESARKESGQTVTTELRTCVCKEVKDTGKIGSGLREADKNEDWSYRQAQLYKESGGDNSNCNGGRYGTCYPKWRYYKGRDLSAAFGLDHVLDYLPGEKSITEVNPLTQHLGAFQAVCLSGIYNRLRMLNSILVGMRNCIIEAKYTGLHDAGMCKEIFSQAVCGLLYKVIAYVAKGCLPISFSEEGKDGEKSESVYAKGFEFGVSSMYDTLETSMDDLMDEYGNAKLDEYFSTGVQGVTKNICLAAFGYDWPYGVDMLMDAAYRVPMKTSALVVPAERELVSYNPTKLTAIHNYRVGASIFPGCKIRSYTVKLKCVGPGDLGKPNVRCEDYQDCPCVEATDTYMESEKTRVIHSDVRGLEPGSYVSVPIESPYQADSVFRYDHVVVELNLDRHEDASKCFDEDYLEGSKGVFYTPITDVTARPLVACRVDAQTGTFTCPDLGEFFGATGNTYFESPYVECWNNRANEGSGDWRPCDALNNFLSGETIKVRPHIFSDGQKQCLHITLGGFGTEIYAIAEGLGPVLRPEYNLGVVTDELLGGMGGSNFVSVGSEGANCLAAPLGSTGILMSGEARVNYIRNNEGRYEVTISGASQLSSESMGYDVRADQPITLGGNFLTVDDIRNLVVEINGFRVSNIISPGSDSGYCRYTVKKYGGASSLSEGVRDLSLTMELKYPVEGDCMSSTQRVKSALGNVYHSTSIKIQKEEKFVGAGQVSGLYSYWKNKQYSVLLEKGIGVINEDRLTFDNALAYYYAVAANVMLQNFQEAASYIKLFEEQRYGEEVTSRIEFIKIKEYLRKIKDSKDIRKYG